MIFIIILYFFSFFLVNTIKNRQRTRYKEFPCLYLKKSGIVFYSKARHMLEVENVKVMQVGKNVYLKKHNNVIILNNIDNLITIQNKMYFTALGKVCVKFNCIDFYRYFNINIQSSKFDLNYLKQQAIKDLFVNLFEINTSLVFLRYLKILRRILNINFNKDKLVIRQNKLHIPFVITYKINNSKKRIYINETL